MNTKGLSVRYLGQVGFLFRHRGVTVVIDPYLTDSVDRLESFPAGFWKRNYAPPVEPAALRDIDLVLCTHDHLDHTDPESLLGILAASPRCRFAGPRRAIDAMVLGGIPAEKTVVLNEGTPLSLDSLTVEPVAAAHEDYEIDAQGYHRFLGYLLCWEDVTVFHAGDTLATPRLLETLRPHAIDIGFLPVNGRDDERRRMDVIGNMDPAEAVDLASRLAAEKGFGLLVPTHHDLYPNNGRSLSEIEQAWAAAKEPKPGLKIFWPGEEMVWAGRGKKSMTPAVA